MHYHHSHAEVIIQMREVKVQVPEGNTSRVCADLTGQLQRDIVVRLTTTTKEGFKGAGIVRYYILTIYSCNTSSTGMYTCVCKYGMLAVLYC